MLKRVHSVTYSEATSRPMQKPKSKSPWAWRPGTTDIIMPDGRTILCEPPLDLIDSQGESNTIKAVVAYTNKAPDPAHTHVLKEAADLAQFVLDMATASNFTDRHNLAGHAKAVLKLLHDAQRTK